MELVAEKYKQTEVGLIPSDWEVFTFGDIVDYTKGFAFKSKDYRKDGIRIIRVSDTTFDSIKKENGIYVDEKDATDYKNWRLDENDLIFTTVGSKPPMYDSMVGKVIMVSKEFEGSFLNQNAVLIRAKKRTKEMQALLLSNFRMKRYLQHIELIYRGNANQASITLKELFEFKIPLPKIEEEQTAIATALSDADALISSLEKLIAKKRMIKQGAMQQLLQPNPDSHREGWEVKKLGEIAEVTMGQSPLSEFYNSDGIGLPLVQGNADVKDRKTIIRYYTSVVTKQGKKGDIIMSVRAPVGEISKAEFDCCLGRGVCSIRFQNDFLYHYLIYFEKSWAKLSTGSTFDSVNSKQVKDLDIPIPQTPDEQNRIATILSDMDAEIAALETKLEKYRKVKLGMMQNLLTGKIRLI